MENKIKELEEKLLRKEQELQEAMDNYVQLDLKRVKEYNELVDIYKAKEQECEQEKTLKEMYFTYYKAKHGDIKGELFKLKAECEGLKNQVLTIDDEAITVQVTQQQFEEYNKFKQTLAEIKEVIGICKCHNADGCYECKYFDDCEVEGEEIPTRDVCKLILQLISEVEL